MARVDKTIGDLHREQGQLGDLATGQRHQVVLGPAEVTLFEIDAGCFRRHSAMFLAEGAHLSGSGVPSLVEPALERLRPRGLGAIASVIRYALVHPELSLSIFGHVDPNTSEMSPAQLSEHRAGVVHALVIGDREAFGEHMNCPHLEGAELRGQKLLHDRMQILEWIEHSFPPLRTSWRSNHNDYFAAVRALQRGFNEVREALGSDGPELAVDADWGPNTCKGVFDFYRYTIASSFGLSVAALADKQAEVAGRFVRADKPFVSCGTEHPRALPGLAGSPSGARRVDVAFVPSARRPHIPCLDEDVPCDAARCDLYDAGRTLRVGQPIPVMATILKRRDLDPAALIEALS